MRRNSRPLALAALAAALGAALAGCSASASGQTTPTPTATTAATSTTNAKFSPHIPGLVATTYDEKAVPSGAAITVSVTTSPTGTVATVHATGLVASRTYSLDLHRKACGPAAKDAGAAYGTDFAKNGKNPFAMELSTDADGAGEATAAIGWNVTSKDAASLVLANRADDASTVGCVTLS